MCDPEVWSCRLVENLQRHDLSAMDEAQGYRRLIDPVRPHPGSVGPARRQVPEPYRQHAAAAEPARRREQALRDGVITAGHARALLTHPAPDAGLRQVIDRRLSVRQTEALAARPAKPARRPPAPKDADTRALEQDLGRVLGLKVAIEHGKGSGDKAGGSLTISYKTLEQLDDVIARLNRNS